MEEDELWRIAQEHRQVSTATRRDNVLRLLQDGDWHATPEINHPAVGGSDGTRRLRELRRFYPIVKRPHAGHDDFEYRLLPLTEALRRRRGEDSSTPPAVQLK